MTLLVVEYGIKASLEWQAAMWVACLAGIAGSVTLIHLWVCGAAKTANDLRTAAEAVGRSDFSRRLEISSSDEFGALASAFNEMSANLQSARTELEKTRKAQAQSVQREKLSAMSEFVAGVAHELNNPLTSLIGFADLLDANGVDEKQKPTVDFIVKSSRRCHEIVQNLLSFARQAAPEHLPIKVEALLDSAIELTSHEMRISNIAVQTRYETSLPEMVGDAHQLQQVMLKILCNAREAIEPTQKPGRVRIVAERHDSLVRITISDDGPGISEENLRRIFDPFFTTKPVGQGTGLGLSLCYGIVKEHGGSIQARSELGKGATFTIELPARAEQSTAVSAQSNIEKAKMPHAGKRVLVVDDEEWILTLTRTVLEEDGYIVDIVTNGDEALSKLTTERYDLLICDQKMPGLSGTQLYERLLAEDPEAAARLIFMTGDVVANFQEFLREARKPCLTKPFSLTQLRTTVAGAIAEQ